MNGIKSILYLIKLQTWVLTASVTEITNANTELVSSIEKISLESNKLADNTKKSNEMLEQIKNENSIESKVDSLAKNAGKLADDKYYELSNDDFSNTVELAVTAHTSWLANLKSMAENMKVSPIQTDEHKCGFGHFYYSVKPISNKILPLWNEVEKYHHEFHEKGDTVIESIKLNNREDAAKQVKEAQTISEKIIDIFNRMITITKDMTRSGEQVF